MENKGSVVGWDSGATADIDWDFDPTPHIGRTRGTPTFGFAFSQASNSVEGQEASSIGNDEVELEVEVEVEVEVMRVIKVQVVVAQTQMKG